MDYLSYVINSSAISQTIVSLSWAGYIVSKHASDIEVEVTGIWGCWVVPEVNVTSGDGYSSVWVGIGGQVDKTLIQVGTEQDSFRGHASYHAWYELLPDYSIKIPSLNVSAGDKIQASISQVEAKSNIWNIQLTDVTKGQSFTLNVVYNSTSSSGEWIIERPTVNSQISDLADYGTATFSDCQITVNGSVGAIGNFTYSRIEMTNQQTSLLTTISQLTPDGSSFQGSYIARN